MRFLVFVFTLLSSAAFAEEFTARVINVHDADTIVVLLNARPVTLRLKGINCPETGEAKGLIAKKQAQEAIQGKMVRLKTFGKDKYGRTIADVYLENGKLVNQELVLSGNCSWGRSRAMRH
jgi:endonuclease YncB( thermonuclease family)